MFGKRTLLLLTPLALAIGISAASGAGRGNRFDVPITSDKWDPNLPPVSLLAEALDSRPLPVGVKEYGDVIVSDEFKIENLSPFYSYSGHWFKKVSVDKKGPIKFSKNEERYTFKKEDFKRSVLNDKGDINLVIDLEIDLKGEVVPVVTSVSFSSLLYQPTQEIPLVRINEEKTIFLKCSQNSLDNSISFELSEGPASIRVFYFTFSNNPPLPFLNIFNSSLEDSYEDNIVRDQTKFKQVFLDRWSNKSSKDVKLPKYEYKVKEGFWRSSCVDPYKVGGFIDENRKPSVETIFALDKQDSFIEQQKKIYEDFNPRGSINHLEYTTPTPCENIDSKTKDLLFKSTVNKELVPKPIQELLENGKASANSKIIQGSFRASGEYEESIQSNHRFNLKIDKKTLGESLIEHEKLEGLRDKQEISVQLLVNIPYVISIYDPASNFLKKQKIDLNTPLDIRSIFNQNKYSRRFFTYDIGKIKGYSGSIDFNAGLFLDLNGDLNIQFTTNVKGFVSTKELRDRRKHQDAIPPFIVLELSEEPKVTSFYLDRKPNSNLPYTPSDSSGAVTTLSDFKAKRLNRSEFEVIKQLDRTNNGEVYFEKIDVTDPHSEDQQKALKVKINEGKPEVIAVTQGSWWKEGSYFASQYYVPRRNYGEVSIEDTENLKEVVLHIKGSSSLGGDFFRSMHYNTQISYSHALSNKPPKEEFADGGKYETIEKDKESNALRYVRDLGVKVDFEALKDKKVLIDFQTVIHKSAGTTYDDSKEQVKYLLTELKPGSVNPEKLPKYSLVTVWYSLEVWYDSKLRKICYYTKLRPMSAVANLSTEGSVVGNKDTQKIPGASAMAGFELSRVDFRFTK